MDYKEKNSNNIIKKISKASNKIIKFNGDALGLLSLKLGNENFAYKSLVKSRKLGDEFEETVEEKYGVLSDKAIKTKEKLEKMYLDADLGSLKNKGEKLIGDVKDLNIDTIKNVLVKTETRIYGPTKEFYKEEKIIEDEAGFVLEDPRWEKID
ncbi:MAG: hypothetical protein GX752_06885 [Clostridium sp.]|nr:hypothetical protein [Clostridium sp.]